MTYPLALALQFLGLVMKSTSSLPPLPLLFTLAASLVLSAGALSGCAAEDDRAYDPDCEGEKCDDLTGSIVTVHTRLRETIEIESGRVYTVRPTVDDSEDRSIDLFTDDLISTAPERLRVTIDADGSKDNGRYAFAISYGPGFGGSFNQAVDWYWEDVTIVREVDGYRLRGRAVRTEDTKLGLSHKVESKEVDTFMSLNEERGDMFHFLVVPTWDFWEFDDEGYETSIEFRDQ